MLCTLCNEPLDASAERWHRACGHHLCMLCAVPMLRAGKTLCAQCPSTAALSVNLVGNLVLGTDHEQVVRTQAALAAERQQQVGSPSTLSQAAEAFGDGRPPPPPTDHHQLTTTAAGRVSHCRAKQPVVNCQGKPFCVHFCYDQVSPDAMRAAVEFDGDAGRAPADWLAIVRTAVKRSLDPHQMARCGFSAELFAYCGVTLHSLLVRSQSGIGVVESNNPYHRRHLLEHLLAAFGWRLPDLQLLGFTFANLADQVHYPLVVLVQLGHFDAEALFSFDISFADLQQCLLDQDQRYAHLLDLNVPFWRRALTV